MNAPVVLFRCDASPEIGFGHVYRCLALADELQAGHGIGGVFAMGGDPRTFDIVKSSGYDVVAASEHRSSGHLHWLSHAIDRVGARGLVLDIRDDLPSSVLHNLRNGGILIATLDDPSERRLAADLAFYPPVPQVRRMDWSGSACNVHVGWEWIVLRSEFAVRPPVMARDRPLVLVTMGGSDPAGLTLKAVASIDSSGETFDTIIAVGPGFGHGEELEGLLARTIHHFDVRKDISNMSQLMAEADLAIASFGVTAYELAAMSVPAIYLCLSEDHAESALAFVDAGIGHSMGVYDRVTSEMLGEEFRSLLTDVPRRLQMAERARQHLDGQGAKRVASTVVASLQKRQ